MKIVILLICSAIACLAAAAKPPYEEFSLDDLSQAEGVPYPDEDQQLLEARDDVKKTDDSDVGIMPESANYKPGFRKHCFCFLCVCIGKRRKRSIPSRYRVPTEPRFAILGSEKELELYDGQAKLGELANLPVVRADLYARRLLPGVSKSVWAALGGKQYGVVITVEDGRRFLAVKGNQMGRGMQTTLIIADHMTDDWTKIFSKDIRGSRVRDFAQAGGYKYNLRTDNGNQAASRMMELE